MFGIDSVLLSSFNVELTQQREEIVFPTGMIFIDTLSKCEQILTSFWSFSLSSNNFLKWKKKIHNKIVHNSHVGSWNFMRFQWFNGLLVNSEIFTYHPPQAWLCTPSVQSFIGVKGTAYMREGFLWAGIYV